MCTPPLITPEKPRQLVHHVIIQNLVKFVDDMKVGV